MRTVGSPECIKCGRGDRYNSASLMGNEPFYLVPANTIIDDVHHGKTWVVLCGRCLGRVIDTKYDLMNLIPKREIIIIVKLGATSIEMR